MIQAFERDDVLLVDLNDADAEEWVAPFRAVIDNIAAESTDRLRANYLSLKENFRKYETFNLVVEHGRIVGFSALQLHGYPETTGRVLSRLYYPRGVRAGTLKGREFPSYATKYMLPYQLERAKSKGVQVVFLSMHGNRRRYLAKLSRALNGHFGHDWKLLDGLWNTCRPLASGQVNPEDACWQSVIAYSWTGCRLPLPSR